MNDAGPRGTRLARFRRTHSRARILPPEADVAWTITSSPGEHCVAEPAVRRRYSLSSADSVGAIDRGRRSAREGAKRRGHVRRSPGEHRSRGGTRIKAGGYPGAAVVVGRK